MITLKKQDYGKVRHLVKSQNELSVFSVLDGELPGKVMVNSEQQPNAVFIETSETKLMAGSVAHEDFNREISGVLDFWDSVTPDTEEWRAKIADIHPNRFIREYIRYRYTLTRMDFIQADDSLPEGYVLEYVNLKELKHKNYINANRIYDWAEAWGSEERFDESGCGCYIRKDDHIVSWSLSDCCAGDRIAIGIHTDPKYRKMGFAKKVVSAVVQLCLEKGYNHIEWLCVSSNSGSKVIAESLGFKWENKYISYSSFPPIENFTDLEDDGWYEWGTYLENAAREEPKLSLDSLYCFIKANAVEKTMMLINEMAEKEIDFKLKPIINDIASYQKEGLCSAFNTPSWNKFVEEQL
ncbi:GNAT family N-acetyltransferase [Paenibacillus sp. N3/727]|uniref:GNAT family N-acetyltransferase n=1 Tax=Paenibacillus sp. N3/727 TaxID=2925845 RepID=UPI001F533E62|nr:GNAT family N-acetyltransferase [Paenibacillus sp. N3/727]UNK17388.1 GNAT family N-acetyltransferase [Paenibacillus sp. N3/727]